MKTQLAFDFVVNKENNTITVKKEFAAKRQLVWDCFTKSELLDQWFGPKPYKVQTKSMDFREGGHWLFAMIGPEGDTHWSRMNFKTIQPIDRYTADDIFCDENGKLNPELPAGNWTVTFTDQESNVMVNMNISYASLADLEAIVKMGMQEGLTMTLEQLEKLLQKLSN